MRPFFEEGLVSDTAEQDPLLQDLRQDFLESTEDHVLAIDQHMQAWGSDQGNAEQTLLDIQRRIHSIKGLARSMGFPFAGILAHRLEDCLQDCMALTPALETLIGAYMECLKDIIDMGEDPCTKAQESILAGLPQPGRE